MKKTIAATLIFLAGAAVQAQEWKTLNRSTYSIKYPASWMLEPGVSNEKFWLTSGGDTLGTGPDMFVENVDLTVNTLGSVYTPKQYADFSKTTLPQKIKNFKVLEEKACKQGVPGYYMVFKGSQGKDKLKWKQYYFIKGGKVFIITFTAEESKYAAYIKNIGAMLSSFTVK